MKKGKWIHLTFAGHFVKVRGKMLKIYRGRETANGRGRGKVNHWIWKSVPLPKLQYLLQLFWFCGSLDSFVRFDHLYIKIIDKVFQSHTVHQVNKTEGKIIGSHLIPRCCVLKITEQLLTWLLIKEFKSFASHLTNNLKPCQTENEASSEGYSCKSSRKRNSQKGTFWCRSVATVWNLQTYRSHR